MSFLERMKVSRRLSVFPILAILGVAIIITESFLSSRQVLLDDRRVSTRNLVEVAHGTVAHWYEQEAKGALSREQAQAGALAQLKTLRYEGKEYFWVNDMHPKMVMHPYKPELDGKDLTGFADPAGKRLFVAFVDTVKKDGAGFVPYLWPKPDKEEPVAKISYVKGFAPWGWVIGSGIYLDEMSDTFWGHATHSIALAAGLVVLLFLAVVLVSRSVTRQLGGEPVYALEIARRVASGDLNSQVVLQAGDDSSVLHAMGLMQSNLAAIVRQIQSGAQRMSEGINRLAVIAGNIRNASDSQGTAANSTAAAANQIAGSIGQVSDSANDNEAGSRETSELSKSGEQLAQQATAGIAAVAATVDVASQQIQSLKDKMGEIGNFSKVIKDIADQTNLLALNAAIEAARAGEQGRGFAVVADEVRKLAERASNATAQIAEVIGAVEHETQTTVGSIEAIVPQVGRGAELSDQAAKALNRINAGAETTLRRVRDVAHAMNELRQASNSITDNVAQIATMVDKNSAEIKDAAETSEALRQLADELSAAVARFRVSA